MAFEYSFKLNDEPILATLGTTVIDKLEEPLDESGLHIPITVFGLQYKMLGRLDIEATDIENEITKSFTYLIFSDKVNTVSKDGFYSHDLRALEYTHKLDKYLINALTFTRPFIRDSRPPFTYNFEDFFDGGSGTPLMYAKMPKIELKQYFILGENEIIQRCEQALTPIVGGFEELNDVYISSNASGNTAKQILSQSNAVFNFTIKGDYEIYVGIFDGVSYSDPVFTFFIKVIDDVRYTLYDMIMRVRAIAPLENTTYFPITRLFDIDESLVDYFKQVEMPQMFLSQMTARQMLNVMFKYINAISRLIYIGGGVDKLSIDEFNKIQGTYTEDGIVDFSSELDASQYGSKGISWLSQTLQSNFRDNPSIKTPAQDRFKTVRSTNIQMTDTDFELKLEDEIYELSKLEVVIPNIVVVEGISGNTFILENYVLDLTHRIVEKSFWNLKNITNNFPTPVVINSFTENVGLRLNKVSNLFWQRGSKSINFSPTEGFFLENLIFTTIKEALNEEITLVPLRPSGWSHQKQNPNINSGLNQYHNLAFNVEYITLREPTMQVNREDISENIFESEIRINTQSKFTDYGRASRDAYGQLQRSAVPSVDFKKVHTSFDDLLEVGMIDDEGYIITQRSLSFFNEHIEANYVATLDHNRLNEFIGIDQEYRVFENPRFNQVYERRDFYNEYLMITKPSQETLFEEEVLYTDEVSKRIFERLYKREVTPKKITHSLIRTDGFTEIYKDGDDVFYITSPVVSFGGKGGLTFNFSFDDNQVAGVAITQDSGGRLYNDPIKYTNELGFFDRLWFQLFDNYVYNSSFDFDPIFALNYINSNKEYKYPLFKNDIITATSISNVLIGTGNPIFGNANDKSLFVYKDASSKYSFTYQISTLPFNHKDYVLGQSFYSDNPLVSNPRIKKVNGVDTNVSPKMYIYRYENDIIYNKFDDLFIKSGWADRVELTESNVTNTSSLFEFDNLVVGGVKSWAIGDEDGNLYIACNFAYNGFKKFKKHFRPNLQSIGLKSFINVFNAIDSEISLSLDLGFELGKSLTYDLDSGLELDLSLSFELGKSLIFDLDSGLELDLSLSYAVGKSLAFNLDSDIGLGLTVDYGVQKGVGLNLDSGLELELIFSYGIGNGIALSLDNDIGLGLAMAYNIGIEIPLNNIVNIGLSMDYGIGNGIGLSLYNSMNLGLSFIYEKQVVALSLDNALAMSLSFDFGRSKEFSQSLNSGISMGLNISPTYYQAVPPSILYFDSTTTSISLRFKNNSNAQVTVQYSIASLTFNQSIVVNANSTSSVVTFSGLLSASTYTFYARTSKDGIISNYVSVSFNTE